MRSHARAGDGSSSPESPGTLLHDDSESGDAGASIVVCGAERAGVSGDAGASCVVCGAERAGVSGDALRTRYASSVVWCASVERGVRATRRRLACGGGVGAGVATALSHTRSITANRSWPRCRRAALGGVRGAGVSAGVASAMSSRYRAMRESSPFCHENTGVEGAGAGAAGGDASLGIARPDAERRRGAQRAVVCHVIPTRRWARRARFVVAVCGRHAVSAPSGCGACGAHGPRRLRPH